MLAYNPVGYGEEATADEAKPAAENMSFDLKPVVGLPEGIDPNFYSSLGSISTSPLKEKPENLKVPEGIKANTFFMLEIKGIKLNGLLVADEKGKFTTMYLDADLDGTLDEKAVTPNYSYASGSYSNARFNIVNIEVKDKEYGLFVSIYSNSYTDAKTQKSMTYSRITYGLVNSFTANIKLGKDVMTLLVVDKFADGKINTAISNGDVMFLDKNNDKKFGWTQQNSEIVDGGELVMGEKLLMFKIDTTTMKVSISEKTLEFGKIAFNFEGATNIEMSVARTASYNAPMMNLKLVDGVASAPVGKYLIKMIKFEKDGKNCMIRFNSYNSADMIEVSKDKPFTFALDLHFIYSINLYPVGQVEGTKNVRMSGYVYNRRMIEKAGKSVAQDTRVQLTVNNREFTPPMFTVKDAAGKELVKETVGKPFC